MPIAPARAAVRPRILSAESSTPKLLEDEVAELLAAGRPCDLDLVGAHGAGKTTALAHVAAVFEADPRLLLWDTDSQAVRPSDSARVIVTVRATATRAWRHRRRIDLAPWDDDDVLEYLRTRHGDRIVRVFAAWCARRDHDLAAVPAICTAVLDQLAAEPSLTDPLSAVLHALREHPERLPPRAWPGISVLLAADDKTSAPVASDTVAGFFSAIFVLELVRRQKGDAALPLRWRRGLLTALAHVLRAEPQHLPLLRTLATRPDARHLGLVLSALRIAGEQLAEGQPLLGDLCHAWLRGIDLSGRLVQARLNLADLSDAELQGAHFDSCTFLGADLSGASAPHSRWTAAEATELRARGFDARSSRWLHHANLTGAHLAGARFDDAIFERASLLHADLRGAHLPRCSLVDADFTDAKLDDTDLTETNLTRARFADSDMRTVRLDAATCALTEFARCDLSGTRFAALSAPGTKFTDADLTAAHWSNADLRDARFLRASLADIDLEGADLRGASFDRSSFHLGSSRSGLVDSVIACEGSRTGFYTDETLEGHFLAPEAVRKANLRNCDLRGATFDETDFYLVDLRGAKLDPEQRPYLLRCRAILDQE